MTIDRRAPFKARWSHVGKMGKPSADICLSFIGDRRMLRLNLRFRGKDRSADVLAFAAREARTPPVTRHPPGHWVMS